MLRPNHDGDRNGAVHGATRTKAGRFNGDDRAGRDQPLVRIRSIHEGAVSRAVSSVQMLQTGGKTRAPTLDLPYETRQLVGLWYVP